MIKLVIPINIKLYINKFAIKFTGPYGSIIKQKSSNIKLYKHNNELIILNNIDSNYINIIKNIMMGISKGYSQKLKIIGVEFKINVTDEFLKLKLGFSHETIYKIPNNIKIYNPKSNILVIVGHDKQLVSQISAEIRNLKLPEPYKGKGILYFDEVLKHKEGKKN